MEGADTWVAVVGIFVALIGFGAAAELVRRSGSRRQQRQHYILQAFVFGALTGFCLALVILYFVLPA